MINFNYGALKSSPKNSYMYNIVYTNDNLIITLSFKENLSARKCFPASSKYVVHNIEVVFISGISTNNVSIQFYLIMRLCHFKCLLVTLGYYDELDGRSVVLDLHENTSLHT